MICSPLGDEYISTNLFMIIDVPPAITHKKIGCTLFIINIQTGSSGQVPCSIMYGIFAAIPMFLEK